MGYRIEAGGRAGCKRAFGVGSMCLGEMLKGQTAKGYFLFGAGGVYSKQSKG
jgi:hypothetical protein